MPRGRRLGLVPYDPEIEMTFRARRAEMDKEGDMMADNEEEKARLALINEPERANPPRERTIKEYMTQWQIRTIPGSRSPEMQLIASNSCRDLSVWFNRTNFLELRQLIQTYFLEICDTIKMNGATKDATRLKLFTFTRRRVGC